jgi:hypothetical protein
MRMIDRDEVASIEVWTVGVSGGRGARGDGGAGRGSHRARRGGTRPGGNRDGPGMTNPHVGLVWRRRFVTKNSTGRLAHRSKITFDPRSLARNDGQDDGPATSSAVENPAMFGAVRPSPSAKCVSTPPGQTRLTLMFFCRTAVERLSERDLRKLLMQ